MGVSGIAQIPATHSKDSTNIVEMVMRLRQAMEALRRFGEGTKSARRMKKTLVKLMQICMTLLQSNSDHGPAVLSALSANQQGEVTQASGQNRLDVQQAGAMEVPAPMNGVLPDLAPDDPFAVFDVGMQPYWTDNTLDLFADLVGIEPGLTAMMAG